MSGAGRTGYRPGAPIPYRADVPSQQTTQQAAAPERRFGFHPAQYRKAQANDVYRQYQKQVAKDKEETLKKRSERNLDGKLKINNLELVFLTINSRRWFGISQIVSVLFSHRPRSSVVTRMKMLGIEFYCGNYDELRRMKELGGVETHCSRCKLISEQDLVKLLLCFYRFTALPRGKGKISTNGLSTYLDDILREIAMGRVELGRDFQEDDTGKIDEETWSQISERMLLKNAERVEHFTRVPQPKKKDTFAFDVDNEEFVMPVNPSRYIPKSDRVKPKKLSVQQKQPKEEAREEALPPKIVLASPTQKLLIGLVKEENKQDSMSQLLPKLIRAERTKKPPRAIWPRWYPPTGENDEMPTVQIKSSGPSSPESGVSLPAIQSIFNSLKNQVNSGNSKDQKLAKYILEGQRSIMEPSEVKEVKIKRETGEECTVSLADLTFNNIKFGDDDIIQIITRQDLEKQYNKQLPDGGRKSSGEQSDTETKGESEKTEPAPPCKPEPVEYTPEQLEYVQKLKESFDFPYAFPRTKMAIKRDTGDFDYETMTYPNIHLPHYRRNPILDSQMFKKLMEQKRPVLVKNKSRSDLTSETLYDAVIAAEPDLEIASQTSAGTFKLKPDSRNGTIAKNSILKPKGSIIKSKIIKSLSQEKLNSSASPERKEAEKRDRVRSEPANFNSGFARPRRSSDSALGEELNGRESPFLLSDDSGTISDGELTEEDAVRLEHNRNRKRFRKYSPNRERLGSGGSSDGDEENIKPDHVYRFKFKTVSETQDYPYMFARPSSLLRLVKLDKCDYPVGCRSAPFLFDTRPLTHTTTERGPFVRQYDIEPTSENVWSGVSLWAGDESDNSDTSTNGGSQSAPELQLKNCLVNGGVVSLPDNMLRRIVSAGNSPVRSNTPQSPAPQNRRPSPLKSQKSPQKSPYMSGLDILSSVAFNAEKLRNTPTKKQRTPKKAQVCELPAEQVLEAIGKLGKRVSPLNLHVNHIKVGKKRKTEWVIAETDETGKEKTLKIDTT